MSSSGGELRVASAWLSPLRARDTTAKPGPREKPLVCCGMLMDMSFPARFRIRRRAEFLRLQSKGQKHYSRNMLVLVSESTSGCSRLGVTVTRKVDRRAVGRNRFKRAIREIFRLNRFRFVGNFDIVVVARKGATESTYSELEHAFLVSLAKGGYLEKE